MSFTETTRIGLGSRLRKSAGGIIFGFIMCIGSVTLMWWNEGRAVNTAKGLDEGYSQVVSAHSENPDPLNEGKLVHVIGHMSAPGNLTDAEFGIDVNALKLIRSVSMYQWNENARSEKKKKLGGAEETTTTYTYEKRWNTKLIDSDRFKVQEGHSNPKAMAFTGFSRRAENVSLGAFSVSESILSKASGRKQLELTKVPESLADKARIIDVDGHPRAAVYITAGGGDPSSPRIGDTKVSFHVVEPATYSVVANQTGTGLHPYTTTRGTTIEMVSKGEVMADAMFASAQQSNRVLTWVLRFLGLLLLFIGIRTIFAPVVVLGDVVPLFGRILNLGLNLFSGVIAFVIGILVIGMAWIWYRPLLGIALLAVGVGVFLFFRTRARSRTTPEFQASN